ncbi:MAG: hypothetical protein BWY63_02495 [Chloroflexi bacterium ADurb.Bin360]|nr:MAG: hypothetical protein BWY63_02495 [Chloroflexi bacterium ADurb.Bin360]
MSKGWIRKFTLGLVLTLLLCLGWVPKGQAQIGGDYRYFAETRHAVRGEFLEFFDTYGGLSVFGYPKTEPFVQDGLVVQYFQNARFESHPENPAPYRVQLGLLGVDLKYERPRVVPPAVSSRLRHYFPETGHTVAYAFLTFFKANGGIDVFGYPISETHFENGLVVQYFQRMKLEWHSDDRVTPVRIGNLGELYIEVYRDRIPLEALAGVENAQIQDLTPEITPTPLSGALRASMSLRFSVLDQQKKQMASVLVNSDDGQPRPNAQVQIQLTGAAGEPLGTSEVVLTDAQGFARIPLSVVGGRNGDKVFVRATVTFETLQTVAEDVFLLWW